MLDGLLAWWSLAQPDGARVSLRTWIDVHGYASWAGPWLGAESALLLSAVTYGRLGIELMWLRYSKQMFINV